MGVAKIMIRGRRRMQKTIVTIILKMISTIAVIVLSPFGYFSRLPYCALMCCYLIERWRTAAERSEVGWFGLLAIFIPHRSSSDDCRRFDSVINMEQSKIAASSDVIGLALMVSAGC